MNENKDKKYFFLVIIALVFQCANAREACYSDAGGKNGAEVNFLLFNIIYEPSKTEHSLVENIGGIYTLSSAIENYEKRKNCNSKTENFAIDPFN
jgi:hypothetical protein